VRGSIQNVAARIVAHVQSKGPASSHLSNLHWLLIKHRTNFKIATVTYARKPSWRGETRAT